MVQAIERPCPECSGTNIAHDSDSGETVCQTCGLVINQEHIINAPEYRIYTPEQENRIHIGAPQTLAIHDKGAMTEISIVNRDRYGHKLSNSQASTMFRLRKLQKRSRIDGVKERNLAIAMHLLLGSCGRLNLPKSTHERASVIYRKALEKDLVRGRSIKDMVAASLYYAVREASIARSIREIATAFEVDVKCFTRCYRLLVVKLGEGASPPQSKPTQHITRACNILHIDGYIEGQAIRLLQKINGKAGKDPRSLAGAALYIACAVNGCPVTQKDLAEKIGVTEVTIRNRYKEIFPKLCTAAGIPQVAIKIAGFDNFDRHHSLVHRAGVPEVWGQLQVYLNQKEAT